MAQDTNPFLLKTALVHDWLTGMRGGEKCLEILAELFPQADIFTLIHLKGRVSPAIEKRKIKASFVQKLPFAASRYRHYLPLFPRAVESFDLSGYDLVISTSHCVAKGAVTGPQTGHICYCFTPMRYAWDQYQAYFGHLKGIQGAAVKRSMERLRRWDVRTSSRVDHFVAISDYVSQRIRKYYQRSSLVVYPPVDTEFFTPSGESGDYYLVVSALAPYKRLDLVIDAASHLSRPVKIVGTGPEEKNLKKTAGREVEFMGWLSDEDLRSAYRECRALLFPGEEDFGITPLEAMACGKPVIAFGRGGVKETVIGLEEAGAHIDKFPTGIFFHHQNPSDLAEAVAKFEKAPGTFDPGAARKQALKFSRENFRTRMKETISELHGRGSDTGPKQK